MKTLREIRTVNRRKNLLLEGMGEEKIKLPEEVVKEGKNFIQEHVKPSVARVLWRAKIWEK